MMLNTNTQLTTDTDSLEPVEMPARATLADMAKIKNIHSDGVYIKAYRVPAGLKIYSKRFPDDHVTILGQGSVMVENGDQQLKFLAPAHFVFEAMTRYTIYTLADSVWYCVHATTETDPTVLAELY
jgi:5-deoxy-D-glucuronate isomerase